LVTGLLSKLKVEEFALWTTLLKWDTGATHEEVKLRALTEPKGGLGSNLQVKGNWEGLADRQGSLMDAREESKF